MAEMLKDNELEEVSGGKTNTTDRGGAHWQDTRHHMGDTFFENGVTWYRIKSGDSLSGIAQKFHTTAAQLQKWNPKTITNVNTIFAGDTIVVCNGHL